MYRSSADVSRPLGALATGVSRLGALFSLAPSRLSSVRDLSNKVNQIQ